ncbi:MAG: glycosyltransferase family 39 protein [Actinomycetota bacterium]|nr:glycosyltransferase family 39 protein [Actinomycetota bacterium]
MPEESSTVTTQRSKALKERVWRASRSLWPYVFAALVITLVFGQFMYGFRSSGRYLEDNRANLSCYHAGYILVMILLGIAALTALACIISKVTGSSMERSFKNRVIAASPLLFLLPNAFAFTSMKNVFGHVWPLFFIAASIFLQLFLAYREARSSGRQRHYYIFLAVFILMAVAFALRLQNYFAMERYVGSDDGILGLMARHILYKGEWPVFFYGQAYNSAVDAYFMVPIFYILGPVAFGVKLSSLIPHLVAIPFFYLAGRELYDEKAGLAAACLASIAPSYLVVMSNHQLGGYAWVFLLSALAVYLLLKMDDDDFMSRHPLLPWLIIGFISGLLFYLQPISIPIITAILLFLMIRHYRIPLLPYLASFVVGCLPLVLYNFTHDFATFDALKYRASGGLALSGLLGNIRTEATISLPVLLGVKKVDTLGFGFSKWFVALVALFYVAAFVYLVLRLINLARNWKETAADRSLRRQRDGIFIILLIFALVLFYYAMTHYVVEHPRYPHHILVIYIPIFLAVGYFLSRMVEIISRRSSLKLSNLSMIVVIFIVLVPPLVVNAVSVGQIENQDACFYYNKYDFSELTQFLRDKGIDRVYTGYMYCYKLVFESGEKILATPNAGPVMYDRYPFYTEQVDAAEEVAVVFNTEYITSIQAMELGLEAVGIDYQEDRFGIYVVFWDFSERPDIYQYNLPN